MHEHLLIDIFVEQRDLHFERLDVAISHIRSYLLQGYDNKQMVVSPEIRLICFGGDMINLLSLLYYKFKKATTDKAQIWWTKRR